MSGDQKRTRETNALRAAVSPSAKAIIMTFWGDMLVPFGGRIWLGSLIRAMAPLGLDERAVRTSVHRLIAEGWLIARTVGRRRELSMPAQGLEELTGIQRRMYRRMPLNWDGAWRIVVMRPSTPARRESLRRELRWQGYAKLAPNTLIHPRQDWEELERRLESRGLRDEISHSFTAHQSTATEPAVGLWPLDKLGNSWAQLGKWAGLADFSTANGPEDCFVRRLLIAHALRLAVLRDPALPTELLPADWPETRARLAVSRNYNELSEPAWDFGASVIQLADDTSPSLRREESDWRFSD